MTRNFLFIRVYCFLQTFSVDNECAGCEAVPLLQSDRSRHQTRARIVQRRDQTSQLG